MMEHKDFLVLVNKMRQAQKNWYKTRERRYLYESKKYEAQVDRELYHFYNPEMFFD